MSVFASLALRLAPARYWARTMLVLLLLLIGFSLWGCGRPANAPAGLPRNPDMITIGTTLKPRTLDPADSYEVASLLLAYNLGETLYTYRPGTTVLEPRLAKALPILSSDALTYRIPLRQGVKFHDGSPFNAAAMAFSLRRFMENGGKPSFLLTDTVATVEAVGDWELRVTLKKPFAAFPALLAFPGAAALSPQAYEIGAGKFKPDGFVGTGPYRLVSLSNDSLPLPITGERLQKIRALISNSIPVIRPIYSMPSAPGPWMWPTNPWFPNRSNNSKPKPNGVRARSSRLRVL